MNHFKNVLALFLAMTVASFSFAQDDKEKKKEKHPWVDKKVVTISWESEFKLKDKVIEKVEVGRIFEVDRVSGNWVHVRGKSGWIHRRNLVTADRAVTHFSIEIRRNNGPKDYHHRGLVYTGLEQYEKAIADFDKAISIRGEEASYYNSRGWAYHRKGDHAAAMTDYEMAIKMAPKDPRFINNRGILHRDTGKYENALKDHDAAIKLDPSFAPAYNARAWLNSTCTDTKFINATRAVEDAKRACVFTNWRNDIMIGTLAAAYARSGDFENATKWLITAQTINPNRFTDERKQMKSSFEQEKAYTDAS